MERRPTHRGHLDASYPIERDPSRALDALAQLGGQDGGGGGGRRGDLYAHPGSSATIKYSSTRWLNSAAGMVADEAEVTATTAKINTHKAGSPLSAR